MFFNCYAFGIFIKKIKLCYQNEFKDICRPTSTFIKSLTGTFRSIVVKSSFLEATLKRLRSTTGIYQINLTL